MKDLDAKLRAALSAEDEEMGRELEALSEMPEELSVPEAVIDSLQHRSRNLVIATFVAMAVFLGMSAWAGVAFFGAENMHEMLAWALAIVVCLMCVMAMGVWYWIELNKNAIKRDIKRVELQLAAIATQLDTEEEPTK